MPEVLQQLEIERVTELKEMDREMEAVEQRRRVARTVFQKEIELRRVMGDKRAELEKAKAAERQDALMREIQRRQMEEDEEQLAQMVPTHYIVLLQYIS